MVTSYPMADDTRRRHVILGSLTGGQLVIPLVLEVEDLNEGLSLLWLDIACEPLTSVLFAPVPQEIESPRPTDRCPFIQRFYEYCSPIVSRIVRYHLVQRLQLVRLA